MKEAWTCPKCEEESRGWVCPNCGWSQGAGKRKCQECTFVNKGSDKDCELCGVKLKGD
mgnify:FL=1